MRSKDDFRAERNLSATADVRKYRRQHSKRSGLCSGLPHLRNGVHANFNRLARTQLTSIALPLSAEREQALGTVVSNSLSGFRTGAGSRSRPESMSRTSVSTSRTLTARTCGHGVDNIHPAWSPDGRSIDFTSGKGGQGSIHMLTLS